MVVLSDCAGWLFDRTMRPTQSPSSEGTIHRRSHELPGFRAVAPRKPVGKSNQIVPRGFRGCWIDSWKVEHVKTPRFGRSSKSFYQEHQLVPNIDIAHQLVRLGRLVLIIAVDCKLEHTNHLPAITVFFWNNAVCHTNTRNTAACPLLVPKRSNKYGNWVKM